MSERVYLRPPWFARVAGNRVAVLFRPAVVSRLSARGRRSGRRHTVPVAVLDHDHGRYLLAPRGETDWLLNLRASAKGRRLQARVLRVINVPIRAVLGLPVAAPLSGRLMPVYFTGRKTPAH
jgi:hypothetical protein